MQIKDVLIKNVTIRRLEYIVEPPHSFLTHYVIYYPKPEFVFYMVEVEFENLGEEVLNLGAGIALGALKTDKGNFYHPMYFCEFEEGTEIEIVYPEDPRVKEISKNVYDESKYDDVGAGSSGIDGAFYRIKKDERPVAVEIRVKGVSKWWVF